MYIYHQNFQSTRVLFASARRHVTAVAAAKRHQHTVIHESLRVGNMIYAALVVCVHTRQARSIWRAAGSFYCVKLRRAEEAYHIYRSIVQFPFTKHPFVARCRYFGKITETRPRFRYVFAFVWESRAFVAGSARVMHAARWLRTCNRWTLLVVQYVCYIIRLLGIMSIYRTSTLHHIPSRGKGNATPNRRADCVLTQERKSITCYITFRQPGVFDRSMANPLLTRSRKNETSSVCKQCLCAPSRGISSSRFLSIVSSVRRDNCGAKLFILDKLLGLFKIMLLALLFDMHAKRREQTRNIRAGDSHFARHWIAGS